MALHIYLDASKLSPITENPQTKLISPTTADSTVLKVSANANVSIGDTLRLGQIQVIVASVSGSDTINITTPIGAIFPTDTVVTKSNMTNPDVVVMSGTVGGTDSKPLYVANDQTNKRYSTIQLSTLNDSVNVNVQYALDVAGSPGGFSDTLNLPSISAKGAGSDTIKIWRKVIIAPGQESQEVVDIKHKITAIEYAVY